MLREFFSQFKQKSLAESLDGVGISMAELETLEKCQIMLNPEEVASAKEEVIQTINSIGKEVLNETFAQLFQALVHKDRQHTGQNESRILRAILLAAYFVRDKDPELKNMLFKGIQTQYTKFFERVGDKLGPEELEEFKGRTVGNTFIELTDEEPKKFDRRKIQKSMEKMFAPELKQKS